MKGLYEGNYDFTWFGILVILPIVLSPALLLSIIGSKIKNKRPKKGKILQIIAVVYIIIGVGTCGIILTKMQ